ncbi:MAG: SUMF1/EgtB/PvdO family nonheme iron enzyme [bacterium]|nr:SUMF1/EgtB/PvdO family nonheme iron enzyme [bacterium]
MSKRNYFLITLILALLALSSCTKDNTTGPDNDPPPPGEMVLIPAGTFTMGSTQVGGTAIPEHQVHLDAYWMDKYEVTNAQYKLFCDTTGHHYPSDPGFSGMSNYFTNSLYSNYPVVRVSWFDADSFATWAGKRLPTEAEWERAAKGDQDNRLWPWGDNLGTNNANIYGSGDGYTYTSPVGTFPTGVSPAGCYDMAGNVCEWCNYLLQHQPPK